MDLPSGGQGAGAELEQRWRDFSVQVIQFSTTATMLKRRRLSDGAGCGVQSAWPVLSAGVTPKGGDVQLARRYGRLRPACCSKHACLGKRIAHETYGIAPADKTKTSQTGFAGDAAISARAWRASPGHGGPIGRHERHRRRCCHDRSLRRATGWRGNRRIACDRLEMAKAGAQTAFLANRLHLNGRKRNRSRHKSDSRSRWPCRA